MRSDTPDSVGGIVASMEHCDICGGDGFFTPYDSLTDRTRSMCKMHYAQWAKVDHPQKFKLSAEQRVRARMAQVEIDMASEPTSLQRLVEEEEMRQQEEKIAPALLEMMQKFGTSE